MSDEYINRILHASIDKYGSYRLVECKRITARTRAHIENKDIFLRIQPGASMGIYIGGVKVGTGSTASVAFLNHSLN